MKWKSIKQVERERGEWVNKSKIVNISVMGRVILNTFTICFYCRSSYVSKPSVRCPFGMVPAKGTPMSKSV